jgi:hypothetical protein
MRTILMVMVFLFLTATSILAQSDTSSISGTVTDTSGALVPNAQITIHNNATLADRTISSNENGAFTLTNLAPGDYSVRVTKTGFQTTTLSDVHLDPSIGRRIDIAMKVGDTSVTITVEAGVNTVQTESGAVGQLITQEQVKSIQLNGRNPLYLAQMEPGVVRTNPMASFSFGLDNGINVNGARSQESVITYDGAPMVRTRSNGTSVGVADVDSTSQVQVLTTSYPAEYGRTSGGQIRMIPKSGTSDFHGSVFEYFRNTALNANTWQRNFNNQKRQGFHYNQFGWNLNGPIYIPGHFNQDRKKLFFLVGEEWTRYNHDDLAQQKVPTALMRTGNFSELLSPNIFYNTPVQIVNPTTSVPYPNNVIPQGQLSANGVGLLNAYPAANTVNNPNNWIESKLYTEAQRKDSVVVDFVPNDTNHFRFSLLNYNYNDYEPHFGNFNTNPRIFNRPNQIGVFRYTWTISPTMVNDAFVSGAADHVDINIDTSSGLYDRTKYGINYPYLYGAASKVVPNKIPTIQLSNFGTLDGGPYPSRSGGIVYDVGDSLTKVWRAHTLKFGGVWEYAGENNYDQISVDNTRPGTTNNQNGLFVFTDARGGTKTAPVPTSNAAVANTALGIFDTYGEIGTRSYTLFRGNMFEGFGQDQWRVSPKLVLEYGIRYSVMTPYHALWGNQAFFSEKDYNPALAPTVNPSTGFITGGDPLNGVVIPGSGFPSSAQGHVPDSILNGGYQRLFRGYSSGYSPTVYSNIQPRLGFAYQITPGTVFRAGAGRYVQRLGISDTVHVGGNAPFQPASNVTRGNVDNPGGIGTNATPLAFTSHAYTYPSPEAWGWNVTVEQEFDRVGVFTLSYVGRRGYHLEQLANVNQLRPGSTQSGVNPDALRPYRGYSTIIEAQNHGGAFYHSMQANLKRRLSNGFLFGVAYTWSKSLDYGSSNGTNIVNAYDNSIMYGPSDFDTRHVLVGNFVWYIPYGTHASNAFVRTTLGNWQFSGTLQGQSGRPQTVSQNKDQAGVGPGSGNQFWVATRQPILYHQFAGGKNTNQWFEPGAFSAAPIGTFAPRGTRGLIRGPGFESFSAALQKGFQIIPNHENHQLIFRAEAFNFANHPNYDNPDVGPTSGTFGRINGKGNTYASERQFQFSLRYAF